MAATTYDVNANLRLRGLGASRGGIQRLAGSLQQLGGRIRGTSGLFTGLVRNALAIGGAYIGVRALASGFSGLIRQGIEYNATLQTMRIGLASIIAGVETQLTGATVSFAEGMRRGAVIFQQLREDAIHSTATTQEMFGIFQAIVGPIRAAGSSMAQVRDITNSTVAAASALGVDFGQAQRDIGLMVRGTAGMDTRMFSLLTSMGLITQSTQEWNRELTAEQRIGVLTTALGAFGEASEEYGRSWTGVTSSFRDITGQLVGTLTGPLFARMTTFLQTINESLLANRREIEAFFSVVGERGAAIFSQVADRSFEAAMWVAQNWDGILIKIQAVVDRVREMLPSLVRAAQAFAAVQVGRQVVGGGLQAGGGALQLATQLGLVGVPAAGAAAAAAPAVAGAVPAAGAAAAGAAGAEASALTTIMSALSAAAVPLAAILAVVASVVLVVVEQWDAIVDAFAFSQPLLQGLWTDLQRLGEGLWHIIRPIARLIGAGWLVFLGSAFLGLLVVLRILVFVISRVVEGLAMLAGVFERYVVDPILSGLGSLIRGVGRLLGAIEGVEAPTPTGPAAGGLIEQLRQAIAGGPEEPDLPSGIDPPPEATGGPRARRITNHNYARGSIQVRQEFRQADPDRVAIQMFRDIERQAESRIQSGFVPALTR